jgi:hypothetical protein
MGPLGLPLAACAAVIGGCLGTTVTDPVADVATIASIETYCASSWQRANIPRQDWNDCSHHAMVRLLSRVSQDAWAEAINNVHSRHRRELNRCIWATTQWWRRSYRYRSLAEDDVPDRDDTPQVSGVTARDVQEAIDSDAVGLTDIQRRVIELWVCGHTITDMAARLEVSSRRISDEKYRAIAKLRSRFCKC